MFDHASLAQPLLKQHYQVRAKLSPSMEVVGKSLKGSCCTGHPFAPCHTYMLSSQRDVASTGKPRRPTPKITVSHCIIFSKPSRGRWYKKHNVLFSSLPQSPLLCWQGSSLHTEIPVGQSRLLILKHVSLSVSRDRTFQKGN